MGKVHVVNVVHAEPNWWDDQLTGLDLGTTALLDQFHELAVCQGFGIPITWCLFFANGDRGPITGSPLADILDQRQDFFRERCDKGDELGIHPHAFDPRDAWQYFKANAQKLEDRGFPYPSTHAPCNFCLNATVLRALSAAGIRIDAGLLVRAGRIVGDHHNHQNVMMQDASRRDPGDCRSYRPYTPSYDDISQPGECSVVEVPIFFSVHGIGEQPALFVKEFQRRWHLRNEVKVDIGQFFWHPWEMLVPGTREPARRVLEGYKTVYAEIGRLDDVIFSTMRGAVAAWHEAT